MFCFQNETGSTTDDVMYYTPTSVCDLNVTPHSFINSSNRQLVTQPRNVLVTPSEYPFVTLPRFTEFATHSFVDLALFTKTEDVSFQTPPKMAASTNYSFATPPRSRETDDHSLLSLKLFTDNWDESYLTPSRFTGCVSHPFVTPPRSTDFADNSFLDLAPNRESDNHSLRTSPTFIHTVFVTPRKSRRAILSDSMITPLKATNHVRHSALTPSPSLDSVRYSRPARRRRLSSSNSEISPARSDVSTKRHSSVQDMRDEIKNKTYISDIQVSDITKLFHMIISFIVSSICIDFLFFNYTIHI